MDPWSWTRQRGTFNFNFLPKIRRGSENSTFTAHNPATFSNEKRFFFPSRSLENREKFNVKKKKKKGKTIIILWPRRKIISSLDKSFVELENFQARHEVFFRQFGRSVNCLWSAYSFILFFSCIQSIFTSFCYNETCNFIWLELKFSSTLKFKITLKNILVN